MKGMGDKGGEWGFVVSAALGAMQGLTHNKQTKVKTPELHTIFSLIPQIKVHTCSQETQPQTPSHSLGQDSSSWCLGPGKYNHGKYPPASVEERSIS